MHNVPKDEVFVIGHKNPDTDSICSAIAYAALKNKKEKKYIPKRAGNINKETEFVLDYFNVEVPELVKDVNIQVKDIAYRIVDGVSGDITMKQAFEFMQNNDATTLPVVEHGKIKGIVTVGDIAEAYMLAENENVLYASRTRYGQIVETIGGKLICGNAHSYVADGKVVVGTAHVELMEQYIHENDIVILSDRETAQIAAIKHGASMIIACLVDKVSDEVIKLAKEKDCAIVITDNDTYRVARLIGQSMPIKYFMIKDNIMTFYEDDTVDSLQGVMSKTRVRYFPVTDENGNYKGLVSRRNFINARKKQLILVDHNERTQSVDGIDKAEICEIIDHHRIANIETISPVYFRNQPLGCTATIVYQMYQEQGVVPDRKIAGILCSAILSDTLVFKSPTCTETDKENAIKLAELAGIDINKFAMEMFDAGSNLKGKTMDEILHQDFKKFDIGDTTVAIGQINSINAKELDAIKNDMEQYLATYKEPGCDIIIFVMTNILDEGSGILCAGESAESLCEKAFGVQAESGYAYLNGVVSRKKQIVPALIRASHEQ
ncbi:MAG: putative manganese-dependent inorganic diphosphatase [Coprococcus sp.]